MKVIKCTQQFKSKIRKM